MDLLIFETFGNLDELREAVMAARDAAGDEVPVIAQVTIDDFGHLPEGTDTETFTREMDSWPVDVIGLNCSVGPKATLETIERMLQYTTKPTSAMPNAGLPMRVEGRNIYLCSPEYMAQYARRLLWAGVKVIGGCCGTTPEHIKLIRSETRSLQPGTRSLAVDGGGTAGQGARAAAGADGGEEPDRSQTRSREVRQLRRNSAAARDRCRDAKSPARSSARSTASTASTCRTGRAPARA